MPQTNDPLANDKSVRLQSGDSLLGQTPQAFPKPSFWVVLLAIGTETPQYMRIEVKTQLTLGYTDPATGVAADVDLSPYGADGLGVASCHVVLHGAQGGLHLRDMGSTHGTALNGIPVDSNKLYKLRQGDVLTLGEMHILLQDIQLETTFAAPPVDPLPVKLEIAKVAPSIVQRVIDYFRKPSDESKPLSAAGKTTLLSPEAFTDVPLPDLEELEGVVTQSPEEPASVISDSLVAVDSNTRPEVPPDQDRQARQTLELPRIVVDEADTDVQTSPDLKSAQTARFANWQPATWFLLISIGAEIPQYLALEIKGQLVVGYADSETGVAPDLDLTPYGAEALGVSRRHVAFLATQAGLHIRDLDSSNGTIHNNVIVSSKLLQRVQEGDVLQLGRLRIVLENARPLVAATADKATFSPKADVPKASPNTVQRAIDYLRNATERPETASEPTEAATEPEAAIGDIALEDIPLADLTRDETDYKRKTQVLPRFDNIQPTADTGAEAVELPRSFKFSSMRPDTWIILLGIGAPTPQYVRIKVESQLTIGHTDFAAGAFSDLDLSAYRAQEMGVSRRHAVLRITDGELYIRDLGSLNGTVLNGFLLDPKKLYKVHEGDVIELGQLRVVLQGAHPSTTSTLTGDARPYVKRETPKIAAINSAVFVKPPQSEPVSTRNQAGPVNDASSTSLQNAPQFNWSLRDETNKRQSLGMENYETQPLPNPKLVAQKAAQSPWMLRNPTNRQSLQFKLAGQKLSQPEQRTLRVTIAAVFLIFLVTSVSLVAVSRPTATPLPVSRPVVVLTASDAFDYFRKEGLQVSNFQVISAPNTTWSAKEEIRFDVTRGNDRGGMLLLNYDSSAQAAAEVTKVSQLSALKKWSIIQVSNFLVVSFPDTPQTLNTVVVKQLKAYLDLMKG